jgi:hypothetical protein
MGLRMVVLLTIVGVGCDLTRNKPSDSDETVAAPKPLTECVEYENAVASCYHRKISIADHPSLIPHNRADESRIRTLCRENLDRFRVACR